MVSQRLRLRLRFRRNGRCGTQSGCWRQQLLVAFGSVSTSGNLIVVGMKWGDSTISVSSVESAGATNCAATSDKTTREQKSPVNQVFELLLAESDKGATGRGETAASVSEQVVRDRKRLPIERPLTCEEAAAFVRVPPKTV
jgi:hypothetical protein